jgi:hypothetical protein
MLIKFISGVQWSFCLLAKGGGLNQKEHKHVQKNERNIRSDGDLFSLFFILLLLTLGMAFGFQIITFPQNKEAAKETVKFSP